MGRHCCRVPDFDTMFDEATARRELNDYRHRGAHGETRRLVEAVAAEGVEGATVLDVGAGVGVVGHELMARGATHLTAVDLSRNYLAAAQDEARDRGYADRADFRYGNFVELAPQLDDADVVTLDRVLCCYPDWRALVDASAARARRTYGLVYPVNRPWWHAFAAVGNLVQRIKGLDFRIHVHPARAVDARIRSAGFERRHRHVGLLWQTVVYRRVTGRPLRAPSRATDAVSPG